MILGRKNQASKQSINRDNDIFFSYISYNAIKSNTNPIKAKRINFRALILLQYLGRIKIMQLQSYFIKIEFQKINIRVTWEKKSQGILFYQN